MLWSLIGAIGSRGLTLVSLIIVARMLGPKGFGEFSAVQSTVGAVLVLAGLGLGMTATKYVAELHQIDAGRAARVIALCGTVGLVAGGLVALALTIFAPTISTRILSAPQLVAALRISALMVLFGTLISMQTGALAGFEAFDTIARINLVMAPIGLLTVVLGTHWGRVPGAIAGLAIAQGLTWILNRRALRIRSPGLANLHFVWPREEERRLLYAYSAPTVLNAVVIAFTNWGAIAALVNTPDGYRQMGIFGAANQWLIALLVVPTIIGQVVFPHATRVLKGGYHESSRLVRHATVLAAAVSLPIVVLGCGLSPLLMRAYGSEFQNSSLTLVVVLITAGIMAMQTPAIHIIAAAGRMWWLLATYLIWAVVFLGVNVFSVHLGALGLATSRLAAYVIHSVAILVTVRATLRNAQPELTVLEALPEYNQ